MHGAQLSTGLSQVRQPCGPRPAAGTARHLLPGPAAPLAAAAPGTRSQTRTPLTAACAGRSGRAGRRPRLLSTHASPEAASCKRTHPPCCGAGAALWLLRPAPQLGPDLSSCEPTLDSQLCRHPEQASCCAFLITLLLPSIGTIPVCSMLPALLRSCAPSCHMGRRPLARALSGGTPPTSRLAASSPLHPAR